MALFACPQCHSIDGLFINVEVIARLIQNDLDDKCVTKLTNYGPLWNNESSAECNTCGWSGLVKNLETPQSKENQNGSSS